MSKHPRFIDLCLSGRALPGDIDEYIAAWHESNGGDSLAEFLGMTDDEYKLWIADESALGTILYSRRMRRPLKLSDLEWSRMLLAARSSGKLDVDKVMQWLRNERKLA